jgi:tetratricopeptide (TPR) repeat protein
MGGPSQETHSNTIGGAARLSGVTVQARDIHGGVHVHAPPRPVPRQLPPAPGRFVNRRADLAALDALLHRRERTGAAQTLIVVSGPAGIGKTALVSRWLGDRGPELFPDGLLYTDLRGHSEDGPVAPGEVLGQFLRALGAQSVPAGLAEQVTQWRSRSAGLRLAVMLDNAFTPAQIRPMLPAGPGAVVVVTSRRRLTGLGMDGAEFHHLAGLDADDGVELLTRGIGADRVAGELPAAQRIVTLCAGLPLAVCLASARLASRPRQPVAALADALARHEEGLAALEVEGEATVSKALDASYAVLDGEAALLYRRLGRLPLPAFDAATAAAACARSLRWAESSLDDLVEANLLEDIGPDTYRFHDLVRVHARELGAADERGPERGRALRRVCDWYLWAATAAEQRLTPVQFTLRRDYAEPVALPAPFEDDAGALAWLDGHRAGLMTLVRAAAGQDWHDMAWQLVDAMWPLFLRLRHYDLWITAHEIGLAAARAAGDARAERQMLCSGAIGLSAARRLADAITWYEAVLRAARAAGDPRDEGQALLGLGGCHHEAGRPEEAVPYLHRAIEVWDACGYPRGTGLARTVLGEVALAADRTEEAAAYFVQARDCLLTVDSPHDAARALAFLGRAHARAGRHTDGTAEMEAALATFTSSGALHWQARTLEMLGLSARERGDTPAARDRWAGALACYQRTGPDDAARVRDLLTSVSDPAPSPHRPPAPDTDTDTDTDTATAPGDPGR